MNCAPGGNLPPTMRSRSSPAISPHPPRSTPCAIVWRDIGLDANRGVKPGPFRYRVELETAKDQWTTILDRSESNEDFLIDYREVTPASARARAWSSSAGRRDHTRRGGVHRVWNHCREKMKFPGLAGAPWRTLSKACNTVEADQGHMIRIGEGTFT